MLWALESVTRQRYTLARRRCREDLDLSVIGRNEQHHRRTLVQTGVHEQSFGVRPRGVCWSVGVAYYAPEEREHRERAHPERGIVEIVGQLERRSRVLERSVESLLEAHRLREPALDERLQRGTRDRLT